MIQLTLIFNFFMIYFLFYYQKQLICWGCEENAEILRKIINTFWIFRISLKIYYKYILYSI